MLDGEVSPLGTPDTKPSRRGRTLRLGFVQLTTGAGVCLWMRKPLTVTVRAY